MNPVPGSITVVVARDFSSPDLDYRTPFLLFRQFDIYTPAGCRLPATAPTVAGHSPREHGQCPCADPELVSFQGPPKRPADHRPMHRIYLAQTEHVTALDTFDGEDHLRVQGWIVHCGHSPAPHTDQGPRIERLGQSGKHSTPGNHDETCKKTKKAIKKSSREAVGFSAARDYAYRTVGRLAWCHGTSSFNFRRAASISLVAGLLLQRPRQATLQVTDPSAFIPERLSGRRSPAVISPSPDPFTRLKVSATLPSSG